MGAVFGVCEDETQLRGSQGFQLKGREFNGNFYSK